MTLKEFADTVEIRTHDLLDMKSVLYHCAMETQIEERQMLLKLCKESRVEFTDFGNEILFKVYLHSPSIDFNAIFFAEISVKIVI